MGGDAYGILLGRALFMNQLPWFEDISSNEQAHNRRTQGYNEVIQTKARRLPCLSHGCQPGSGKWMGFPGSCSLGGSKRLWGPLLKC